MTVSIHASDRHTATSLPATPTARPCWCTTRRRRTSSVPALLFLHLSCDPHPPPYLSRAPSSAIGHRHTAADCPVAASDRRVRPRPVTSVDHRQTPLPQSRHVSRRSLTCASRSSPRDRTQPWRMAATISISQHCHFLFIPRLHGLAGELSQPRSHPADETQPHAITSLP